MKKWVLLIPVIFLFGSCASEYLEEIPRELDKIILEDYFITSITIADDQSAWIGTYGQGLLHLVDGKLTVYNQENMNFPDSTWIRDVEIDRQGNVWIAGDGVIKFDGENFTTYNDRNSDLPVNFVRDIEIDESGKVWIAASTIEDGGLTAVDGGGWEVINSYDSYLSKNMINCITIDNDNNIWLALSRTVDSTCLVKISGDIITTYNEKDLGFSPYWIRDIDTDSDNNLWAVIDYSLSSAINSDQPIAFKFNGKNCTTFTEQGMQNNPSMANLISVDSHDNVWIGNFKEVNVLRYEEWVEKYICPDDRSIYAIAHVSDNEVWFGTDRGICSFHTAY